MSKELFMAAHEDAIAAYLDENPDASWEDAYERTVDQAYIDMRERYADMIDAARQRAKDAGQ